LAQQPSPRTSFGRRDLGTGLRRGSTQSHGEGFGL
jgi:hypothetical protein